MRVLLIKISCMALGLISSISFADMAQLNFTNSSSSVYVTHCIHYQPISGHWQDDEVDFDTKYDSKNPKFQVLLDGEAYFACEVYKNVNDNSEHNKQITKGNARALSDNRGDLEVDMTPSKLNRTS